MLVFDTLYRGFFENNDVRAGSNKYCKLPQRKKQFTFLGVPFF